VLSWRLQFEKNRMRTYVVLIVSYFFKYRIISCVCLVPNMRHIAHLGRRLLKVRSFLVFCDVALTRSHPVDQVLVTSLATADGKPNKRRERHVSGNTPGTSRKSPSRVALSVDEEH